MHRRPYHALALLPAAALLIGVPLLNRVRPFLLGLPFLLGWIVGCVLLTALVMGLIGRWDRAAGPESRPPGEPGSDRGDDAP